MASELKPYYNRGETAFTCELKMTKGADMLGGPKHSARVEIRTHTCQPGFCKGRGFGS